MSSYGGIWHLYSISHLLISTLLISTLLCTYSRVYDLGTCTNNSEYFMNKKSTGCYLILILLYISYSQRHVK